MDIRGNNRPPADAEAFVCFRPKEKKELRRLPGVDAALRKTAETAGKAGEFSGERNETLLLHGGRKGSRLLVVGLGPEAEVDLDGFRRACGVAARALESRGIRRACFLLPGREDLADEAQAAGEGAALALYSFDGFKSEAKKPNLSSVTLAPESGSGAGAAAGAKRAAALVSGVAFTRDLGNTPPNVATPIYLARRARELAGGKMTVKIHDLAAIRRMKMGAFLSVAQGSANPPRLIELRWNGAGSGKKWVALVGKGVTFDTGGISIKPSARMDEMKFDMCGAGAVFGCMRAIKALKLKRNVVAYVPSAENMPSGDAYRPGDIVKARNGKTIEVLNTDAEGRLLLCDALALASEKKPACIVDLATLTGACVIALGDAASGLFGTDESLVASLAAAGRATGEAAWPMPLYPRYDQMMKGTYADLHNVGGREAGACTAAAFLKQFVGEVPWAHLDVAGVAWTDRDEGYLRKGATGYGVRLLVSFLEGRSRG